jgi:hypothetical protein
MSKRLERVGDERVMMKMSCSNQAKVVEGRHEVEDDGIQAQPLSLPYIEADSMVSSYNLFYLSYYWMCF